MSRGLGDVYKRQTVRRRTENIRPHKHLYRRVNEVLFVMAKTRKKPKRLSGDWIKMWYICTMEYYSAIRKNKMLPFATAWLDLANNMLREI